MRRLFVTLAITLAAARASAQTGYERFSLDTTASIDFFHGISPAPLFDASDNVSHQPQIIVDITGTARIGKGWQAFFRPWFRLPRPASATADTPDWDVQIYQASLRYEHAGEVSTRVDLGYMPSPVGLGIFDVNPRQNPTIAGHAGYFTPLLPFDTGSARPSVIASTYPLAGVFTVSASHWDARAAVTNSAPVRISIAGVTTNPKATPVFEAGAGVTPIIGLRLGASFAHGAYLKASEFVPALAQVDRTLTLAGFEGEYAVRYTKISGEVIHDTFTTATNDVGATEWFIQATQTITPRWAIAGRHEGTSAPAVGLGIAPFGAQPRLLANELTAVFRVNRDIMLKGGYYARQSYGRLDWDQQAAFQAVFQHRWW
jgi:hypothetical protein